MGKYHFPLKRMGFTKIKIFKSVTSKRRLIFANEYSSVLKYNANYCAQF